MRKKYWLGMLFLVLFIGLSACSDNKNSKKNTEVQHSNSSLTITNKNRTLEIQATPKKVLTLGPNCTELFIALGLQDYIIGNSLDNHSRGPLPEYAKAYAKIPELTYSSATREAVLSSGADFIYGIDWEFGEEGLDTTELEEYGITTYISDAKTIEESFKEVKDLGEIFEHQKEAEDFIDDQKQRLAAVSETLEGVKPKKVLVYDSGTDGIFTAGKTNFETLLIEKSGGENLFSDITDKEWATVSAEEVVKRNPDIILIHDYDKPSVDEKIKEIKSNPALSQLACVKNENFAVITLESVLPGPRIAYSVENLSKNFHPEKFSLNK